MSNHIEVTTARNSIKVTGLRPSQVVELAEIALAMTVQTRPDDDLTILVEAPGEAGEPYSIEDIVDLAVKFIPHYTIAWDMLSPFEQEIAENVDLIFALETGADGESPEVMLQGGDASHLTSQQISSMSKYGVEQFAVMLDIACK